MYGEAVFHPVFVEQPARNAYHNGFPLGLQADEAGNPGRKAAIGGEDAYDFICFGRSAGGRTFIAGR